MGMDTTVRYRGTFADGTRGVLPPACDLEGNLRRYASSENSGQVSSGDSDHLTGGSDSLPTVARAGDPRDRREAKEDDRSHDETSSAGARTCYRVRTASSPHHGVVAAEPSLALRQARWEADSDADPRGRVSGLLSTWGRGSVIAAPSARAPLRGAIR